MNPRLFQNISHASVDVIVENVSPDKNKAKPTKYRECEENYAYNPNACTCDCGKDSEIDEYLREAVNA